MPTTGLVHVLIDRLASSYGEGQWQPEITAAREEYAQAAGRLFEDDGELYEQRLTAFLEWYVAERPLGGAGKGLCPALAMLEGQGASLSADERAALSAIASSHRSVFEVAAVSPNAVDLLDIIDGARFLVRERRSTVGFQVDDLIEARLFWTGEAVGFGKTFLFHPPDAYDAIVKIIAAAKLQGETRAQIVGRLARTYLRWCRQRDASAPRIYGEAVSRVGRDSDIRPVVPDHEHR